MDSQNGNEELINVRRFLESLAVMAQMFCVFVLGVGTSSLLLYWCIISTTGRVCTLLYFIFVYLDRNTHQTGGRRYNWFRRLAWWEYYKNYFPVSLHKTAHLAADRNYLLAVFPHGVFPVGAFSVFGTDVHHFNEVFPGIKAYLCSLKIMFFLPFTRELFRMCGIVSCSKKSVNWILGKSDVGKACVLVVGGATEALYSQPGVYKTILKRRKGFCRMAIQHGASLVPVVAFREVDLYEIKNEGLRLDSFQKWIKARAGFIPMRFIGEGFLGIRPKRVPIHIVVGSPIEVNQNVNATDEDVDLLHQTFTTNLVHLFDSQKHKYLKDSNTQLQLV